MRSILLALLLVAAPATGVSAQTVSTRGGDGANALGSPFTGAAPPSTVSPTAPATTTPATPGVEAPESSAPPPAYDVVAVPPPPGAVPYVPSVGVRADSTDVRIPSSIATRLRALDADLQILAARGGGSIVDGVLSILTGGISITLGILLEGAGSPSNFLYVYGSVGVARGILSFALMTNPSAAAIEYSHMPMRTTRDVHARLRYGESQLDGIADMARIARILDGSLNIAAGVAVIPIYLGPNNFEITPPFDYFVLIGAAISTIGGVITLFTTTEAERRQGAYHELRDRLLATPEGAADDEALEEAAADLDGDAALVTVRPSMAVLPGGGFASISGTF